MSMVRDSPDPVADSAVALGCERLPTLHEGEPSDIVTAQRVLECSEQVMLSLYYSSVHTVMLSLSEQRLIHNLRCLCTGFTSSY